MAAQRFDALLAHERPIVRAHARGRLLGGLALAMGLGSACDPADRSPADAAVDMPADALPACSSPSRTSEVYPGRLEDDCSCTSANTGIEVMFDASGVITGITGVEGQPLATELEQCLLALVAGYCYPSLAGTTQTMATCHLWIA